MSGLKVVLPTTFTDTSLPKLLADPVMPPGGGALLLMEPAHPANPIAAGLPADGSTIPNIAWDQLAAVLGSGDQSTLVSTFKLKGAINNGTIGKVERTGKGGLHVIQSRTTAPAAGDGVMIMASSALRNYFVWNGPGQGHKVYVSVWGRVTRGKTGTGSTYTPILEMDAGNFNFGVGALKAYGTATVAGTSTWQGNNASEYATAAKKRDWPSAGYVGNFDLDASFTAANDGTANPSATGLGFGPQWGYPSQAAFGPSVYLGQSSAQTAIGNDRLSWIFYRLYVEDLNKSGRTYDQVSALDAAEYNRQVLTAGGRYYGDTFTDPSTIA